MQVARTTEPQADETVSNMLDGRIERVAGTETEVTVIKGEEADGTEETVETPQDKRGPDVNGQSRR